MPSFLGEIVHAKVSGKEVPALAVDTPCMSNPLDTKRTSKGRRVDQHRSERSTFTDTRRVSSIGISVGDVIKVFVMQGRPSGARSPSCDALAVVSGTGFANRHTEVTTTRMTEVSMSADPN